MLPFATGWLACGLAFLALDAVWLSQMAGRFYRPIIGEMMADKPNLGAAAVFYVLYITGLMLLAVMPALERGGVGKAALMGAVLGAFAYGTYDLTNHATLKIWDIRLTVVDMAWGTFLSGSAAAAGAFVAQRFAQGG